MANKNPHVYMDVQTNKLHTQRMIFELFYDTAPFAAENFRALCTGEKGLSPNTQKPLRYKNTYFLKVPKGGSYVEGGAFCYANGTGGESIYGSNFPDELNEPKMHTHDERGLLSIRKDDRNVCGSHFIITLKRDDSLNSSHVVFGKLVEGYDPLKDIEEIGFRVPCKIIFCGHYDEDYESSLDGDRTDVESSSDGDKTVDAGRTSFGRPYEPEFMKDEDDRLMEDIEDDILRDKR